MNCAELGSKPVASDKPKSNPFGAAKPVTVKYGELDEPPPADAKPADAKPADGSTAVDEATAKLEIS